MTTKLITLFGVLILFVLSSAVNAAQFGTAEYLAQSCKTASHTKTTYKQVFDDEPGYCYGMLSGFISAGNMMVKLNKEIHDNPEYNRTKGNSNIAARQIMDKISLYPEYLIASSYKSICGNPAFCNNYQVSAMFYSWYSDRLSKIKTQVAKQKFKTTSAAHIFADFLKYTARHNLNTGKYQSNIADLQQAKIEARLMSSDN